MDVSLGTIRGGHICPRKTIAEQYYSVLTQSLAEVLANQA